MMSSPNKYTGYIKPAIFLLLLGTALLYSLAVYTVGTQKPEAQLSNKQAQEGKLLFQKYNCTACHQLYGLGGYMGPDLTNVMSARNKGEAYARVMLEYGSGRMPNFHLSPAERDALVAFLKVADQSGQSPIYRPEANAWGGLSIADKSALHE